MTTQCEHGQLRRQCEVCEKDEALSGAWSVLEGQRQQIADLTAKLAEGERERDQIIDEADSLRAEVERLNREIVKACDSHCQRTLCEMQRSLDESEARLRDLRVTIEWAHHGMEIARIWGGMEWHWNHLASFRAKAIWERLDAALAKSAVTLP
jgi:predicted RNase H-like nuclease (RuvC/YqgF family)